MNFQYRLYIVTFWFPSLVVLIICHFFLHYVFCAHSLALELLFLSRNLLFLKTYDGDVSSLDLDFTVINDILGETKVGSILQLWKLPPEWPNWVSHDELPDWGTETWWKRHSCHKSKPDRIHPFDGWLQVESSGETSVNPFSLVLLFEERC